MKKALIAISLLLVGAGVFAYLLFTGPRMLEQPNIRSFQAPMPPAPPDSVPVDSVWAQIPDGPPPATPAVLDAGRIYYGYYCLTCHGQTGNGFGPVGESFVPFPADLRSPRVQAYSDRELLRAMVSGRGHAPAPPHATSRPTLEYIVLPQHRWPIVLHVRQLGKAATTQP